MTIIGVMGGLVVIDFRTGAENARQDLNMSRRHVGDKPDATAIHTAPISITSAPAKAVVDVADVATGKVPVIAPDHTKSTCLGSGTRAAEMYPSLEVNPVSQHMPELTAVSAAIA